MEKTVTICFTNNKGGVANLPPVQTLVQLWRVPERKFCWWMEICS